MIDYIKIYFKNNKLTSKLYCSLKKIYHSKDFKMTDIAMAYPKKEDKEDIRLTLVLPFFAQDKVFGGVSSALKQYEKLAAKMGTDKRILILGPEKYSKKYTMQLENYAYNDTNAKNQVVFMSDYDKIPVGRNEIFVCTAWQTAYAVFDLLRWQRETYQLPMRKMVYLIQDFEPGFSPWSSEYALAESTYQNTEVQTIAIFNSKELNDYFEQKRYPLYQSYYFRPYLNEKLAQCLKKNAELKIPRKKQILIYGRQVAKRNAFELLRYSLELFARDYDKANEWSIISLGESFEDVKLTDQVTIHCKGKASLEEYAQIMSESFAGVSLMISPHPSYPPLEMSTFGVKVITNKFENKDLSYFNENIISLSTCSPEVIALKLMEICEQYKEENTTMLLNNDYVRGKNEMDEIIAKVAEELKK